MPPITAGPAVIGGIEVGGHSAVQGLSLIMASVNQGGKMPSRPAPGVPPTRSRQTPTEINDWPPDPFSPPRQPVGKKKPPPRPPPPRVNSNQGSNHFRSIFGSSKRAKKSGAVTAIVKPLPAAPPPPVPTGTLIDLATPPSSPKPVKRNISSLWSLSSSTSSPVESGFEDDFGSLLSSGATTPSSDLLLISPATDPPAPLRPVAQPTSKPTIICVPKAGGGRPERPPPPQPLDGSPPMPSVPPPPPPPDLISVLCNGPPLPPRPQPPYQPKEGGGIPTCTALYDFEATHPDDLPFKTGDVILLLGEEGEEWLRGRLKGAEGLFPACYVTRNGGARTVPLMTVIALFHYKPLSWDDLELQEGDKVSVLDRVNEDWLYGECEGRRGIFPEVYVQDITDISDL